MKQSATSPGRAKKAAIGVALAASLALAPVTAANASTTAAPVAATYSAGAAAAAASIDARSIGSLPTGSSNVTDSNAAEKRGWVKPVIDWIKNNAAGIWNGLKTALKNGWKAFQNFWNGLAGWIKNGITFIAQSSVWEIFQGLWDYFF